MVLSSWVELVEHCKQCKSSPLAISLHIYRYTNTNAVLGGFWKGMPILLHIAWYCECVYDGFWSYNTILYAHGSIYTICRYIHGSVHIIYTIHNTYLYIIICGPWVAVSLGTMKHWPRDWGGWVQGGSEYEFSHCIRHRH